MLDDYQSVLQKINAWLILCKAVFSSITHGLPGFEQARSNEHKLAVSGHTLATEEESSREN